MVGASPGPAASSTPLGLRRCVSGPSDVPPIILHGLVHGHSIRLCFLVHQLKRFEINFTTSLLGSTPQKVAAQGRFQPLALLVGEVLPVVLVNYFAFL